ncbi:MAG: hypothetical protein RL258_843, partial [Pseudomonadota bacterium]
MQRQAAHRWNRVWRFGADIDTDQ